jgi:hypothetical protein
MQDEAGTDAVAILAHVALYCLVSESLASLSPAMLPCQLTCTAAQDVYMDMMAPILRGAPYMLVQGDPPQPVPPALAVAALQALCYGAGHWSHGRA